MVGTRISDMTIATPPADAYVPFISATLGADNNYRATREDFAPDGLPVEVIRPAIVANATSNSIIFAEAPGAMLNSQGTDDAVKFDLNVQSARFSNGPTAQPLYWDSVIQIGWNINLAGTAINATMPSFRDAWESKFAQGGATDPFIVERHICSVRQVDNPGAEIRAHSITVPHLSTNNNNINFAHSFVGAVYSFTDYAGVDTLSFDFRSVARVVNVSQSVKFDFAVNNVATTRQLNAAGNAVLAYPMMDANDAYSMTSTGTVSINGPAKLVAFTGLTGLLAMNATSGFAANGAAASFNVTNSVTGSAKAVLTSAAVSGAFENLTENRTSTGRVGSRIQSTTGIMFHTFNDLTGGRNISFTYYPTGNGSLALDDSQQGGQFASKNAFTVDYATFQCRFGYAPRLLSSTVAALPAFGTAGAGALQYVTDLNATTAGSVAAGGGANKGVVVSSGADWRIMTAWA